MKLSGTSEVTTRRPCWSCGAPVESLYACDRCAVLQRFPETIDYFTLFGIGPRLKIDLARLEATFYELSRKFHPDFYQKKSSEEQAISLENSALVNKAYRTLRDPIQRTEYLIGRVDGGSAVSTEAPADLFDEILELQELLEGVKEAPGDSAQRGGLVDALQREQARFGQIQNEGERALEKLATEWDRLQEESKEEEITQAQRRLLSEMKQILSRRAYLERVLNDIQTGIEKLEKGN
jgi:molecular chaperone HscB